MKCYLLIFSILFISLAYAKDTVVVTPSKPTVNDYLKFNLYNENLCCCATYHEKHITLDDTAIYLNYQVDQSPCNACICLGIGSWTLFESKPIKKAGTYAIYKVQSIYCPPNTPCIAIAPFVSRVGEITINESDFPRMYLKPPKPSMNDTVEFLLILGEHPNGCAPKYETAFSIKQISNNICIRHPCPQDFLITINYKDTSNYGHDALCTQVITPYGPSFEFGQLHVGSYTIIDKTAGGDTLMTFKVTENKIIVPTKDTVFTNPQQPTTIDSIEFKLYNVNSCCITKYFNKEVVVEDTIITLSYEIDNSGCYDVGCPLGGWTVFKSDALKAGTYAIYKLENLYCPPNKPCPYIAAIPKRVGQLTVKQQYYTSLLQRRTGLEVTLASDASKTLQKELYDIKGARIRSNVSKKQKLGVGIYIAASLYKKAKPSLLNNIATHR